MQETLIFHVYLLQAAQINWGANIVRATECVYLDVLAPISTVSFSFTAVVLADILTFLNPLNPPSTSLPTGGRLFPDFWCLFMLSFI